MKMYQGKKSPDEPPRVELQSMRQPFTEVQDALNGIFGKDNAPEVDYVGGSKGDLYFSINYVSGVGIPRKRAEEVSAAGEIESFTKSNVKEALESLVKLISVTIKELS